MKRKYPHRTTDVLQALKTVTPVYDNNTEENTLSILFSLSPEKLQLPSNAIQHLWTDCSQLSVPKAGNPQQLSDHSEVGKRHVATLMELQGSSAEIEETVHRTTSSAPVFCQGSREKATVERNHMTFQLLFSRGRKGDSETKRKKVQWSNPTKVKLLCNHTEYCTSHKTHHTQHSGGSITLCGCVHSVGQFKTCESRG